MKTIKGWLALGLSLAVAACGGGGGGSDASIQLSFTPASVNIVSDKGVAGSQVVTATIAANGITANNLFVNGDGGDVVLADAQLLSQDSTSLTLRLIARADLAVGTYRDELRILLCRDQACTSQYPGSPVRLPISYVVQPTLEVASTLSATRSTTEPLTRVSTPLTLPVAGLQLLATVRNTGELPGIFSPSVVNGELVVDLGYAPVGVHLGVIDLRTADGRYTATTTVNYQVLNAGGDGFITFEEPTVIFDASQGQTLTRQLNVLPPNWSPVLEYTGATGIATLVDRTQVTALGAGRYALQINTLGLAPGFYPMSLGYRSSDGVIRSQLVNVNLQVNLTATASTVTLSSQAPAGPFAGSSAITLADGRNLTWVADPSTVPDWMTLTRSTGLTGVDRLTYTVDAARLVANTSTTASVGISVPGSGLDATNVSVLVQDNLPRIRAALTPLLELGQPADIIISGHFPEDVIANGKLEVFGASGNIFRQGDLLVGRLSNLIAGIPVQLRLRYPAFESSVSMQVRAAPQATATAVFPLAFGEHRPPVYSSLNQSFYFIAEGALQQLVNQSGTWVRNTVSAPGAVDLELDPAQTRLLVLYPEGVVQHDPVTLARGSLLRSFAPGTVSAELATSRNKHLATTLGGQLVWSPDGTACAGRMFQVLLSQPTLEPEVTSLGCAGTTSLAGLATSRDHRYLMLFQNDRSKPPLLRDSLTTAGGFWDQGLSTFKGIATMDWSGPHALDNEGGYTNVFLGDGFPRAFQSIAVSTFAMPAGMAIAGVGQKPVQPGTLTYGYRLGANPGGGDPLAQDPTLLAFGPGPSAGPAAPSFTLALPQAVGCLPGRPPNEPCDHRAHLLTDLAGRHVLILGPQAAMVVPVNDMVTSQVLRQPASLLRNQVQSTARQGSRR